MDYGINIGIGVSGSSRLNAAVNQIERINAAVKNLNANPLTLFKKGKGSAVDEVASLNTEIMDLVRAFTNGEKKIGGTFASVSAQASSFGDVLEQIDGTFTNISSKAAKNSGLDQLARLFGQATLEAEKFAAAQEKIRQQGIAAAQSSKGAFGKFTVLGSPEAAQQRGIFEAKVADQRRKNARSDLMFQRLRLELLTSQARILEDQVRSSSRIGRLAADKRVQSAAISGGFPLLFGSGAGGVVGGAVGGFFGDFAGGIAGSAIGNIFDQLVERANAIGNAIGALDFGTLEQSGVRVNAELQLQIEKLQEVRQFKEAEALLSQEVNAQVGAVPGTLEDAANAGNLLGNAFKELLNAAGATLAIVGAPFAAALALIVKLIADIFKLINTVFSAIGFVIKQAGELALTFGLGEEAVDRINGALEDSSGNLKEARLEAAEFRKELESTYAGLNEQVVTLKQNLKFERQRKTGLDDQSKLDNLALEKRIALQAASNKQIDDRAKLRKANQLTEEAAGLLQSRFNAERDLAEERYQNKVEVFNIGVAKREKAKNEREEKAEGRRAKRLQVKSERDKRAEDSKEKRLQKMAASIEKANQKTLALTEPLQKQLDAIKDKAAFEREYAELIDRGVSPAVAKQTVEINKQVKEIDRLTKKQQREADLHILNLRILLEKAKGTRNEVAAQEALNRALEHKNEIEAKGTEAAQAARDAEKTDADRILDARGKIQKQINDLNDPVTQLISLSETLGNAFSESFKGIVTGSMSAREALANLFQRTADHFLDMAAQMIAAQLKMQILNIGMNFFGGGGSGGGFNPSAPSLTGNKIGNFGGGHFAGFADGGRPPVGRPSLVGERGPELFVPGASGTIIPNHAMGGGANVTVNVDASGSNVEGDGDQAAQLGKAIGIAVQQELIKQKRPGGLLTR